MYSHIISDFSVLNVFQNSHTTKPLLYKISGVWGNHEGSMLLWILVLSFVNYWIYKLYNKTNYILAEKYKDSNVIYLPNIKGKDFFDVIGNSKLVIALHGMITSIAAIQNIKVLDLFYCNIKNVNDFYKYKNSFHEFKPKKDNYEFIIPKIIHINLNINLRVSNML